MKKLIYLFLGLMPLFASSQQMDFSAMNQAVQTVAFPTPTHGVAITAIGGSIMLTDDAGTTWHAGKYPAPVVAQLLGISFADASTGWVVGSSGRIMKTTDGGLTWVNQTSGTTFSVNGVVAVSTTVAYATAGGGGSGIANAPLVLKTINGGTTWTPFNNLPFTLTSVPGTVANTTSTAFSLAGLNTSGTTTYYAGLSSMQTLGSDTICIIGGLSSAALINGSGGKFLKTVNGGASWTVTTISSTNMSLKSVHFYNNLNGFIGANASVLWATHDAGTTWTLNAAANFAVGTNFQVFAQDSFKIYCATSIPSRSVIRKSVDAGVTWSNDTLFTTPITTGSGYSGGGLASISFRGRTGYVSGGTGLIFKIDATTGAYTKLNGGQGWNATDGFFVDGSIGYAACDGGRIMKTTDGGATWALQQSPATGVYFGSIFFTDALNGVAVGSDYNALTPAIRTTDGGATWVATPLASAATAQSDVFFVNPLIGWSVGQSASINKTTDGGATWTIQTSGLPPTPSITFNSVFFVDANNGWIVGASGKTLRTTNGGATWTLVALPGALTTALSDVWFADANTGYTAGASGKFFKSIDGGASWVDMPSGTTNFISDMKFLTATKGLMVSTQGNLFYTENGGTSWTQITPTISSQGIVCLFKQPASPTNIFWSHANQTTTGISNNFNFTLVKSSMTSYYVDADGDGYGSTTPTQSYFPTATAGYSTNNTDCDDTNNTIYPGATELCNSIDDDCDLVADDGLALFTLYPDGDGDGFGVPAGAITGCLATVSGYANTSDDCNDANNAIYPGATETCNSIDDDCDLATDEGLATSVFYADTDGDGFGNAASSINSCYVTVAGYVSDNTDCNDSNGAVYPGATEVCNTIDDNCDLVVDDPLAGTVVSITNADCGGTSGAIDINPTCGLPPYTYLWSNGATTQDLTGISSGVYSVVITDGQGLTKSLSATVTGQTVGFTVSFAYIKPGCPGQANGKITANAQNGVAPYSYLWSNGATTKILSNVAAGTYSVVITSTTLGCTTMGTATLTDPIPLAVTLTPTAAACPTATNGKVTSAVTGGTGGKTYLWSNGGTGTSILNLAPGTYSVVVTDSKGCTASASTVVASASTLTLAATSTNILCNGQINGTATGTSTGGVTPKSYLWSNGATALAISNLAAGPYSLVVTDGAGCTKTAAVTIVDPAVLGISLVSIVQLANGKYKVTVAGAGGTQFPAPNIYRYQKCLGAPCAAAFGSNPVFTNLVAGSYIFSIKDKNNCTASITVSVPAAKPAANSRGNEIETMAFAAAPNPFSNLLNLTSGAVPTQDLKVKMFDITGREVLESNWAAGTSNTEINTYMLPTGVFFVKIMDTEETTITTLKVVKTN